VKNIETAVVMVQSVFWTPSEIHCLLSKRWAGRVNKPDEKDQYDIHDNGGRPFRVFVNRSRKEIAIHKEVENEDDDDDDVSVYESQPVITLKYKRIWIGFGSYDDPQGKGEDNGKWSEGNTILVEPVEGQSPGKKPTRLIVIERAIWEMHLTNIDEHVEKYVSLVGNSDVTYASIWTNKYVYLVSDGRVKASRTYVNKRMPKSKTIKVNDNYTILADVYTSVYYNEQFKDEKSKYWSPYIVDKVFQEGQ
jgi:hypothetical protein